MNQGSRHRESYFTLQHVASTVTKTSLLYSLCFEAQLTAASSANVWLLMEASAPRRRLPQGSRQFISNYNLLKSPWPTSQAHVHLAPPTQ